VIPIVIVIVLEEHVLFNRVLTKKMLATTVDFCATILVLGSLLK
jgi:hypothetical protein